MMPPLSLFSYVDVNFIKYSRELTCCYVLAKQTQNMAKYGVYVYDLLKILGGVCPEGKQLKSNIKFQY